MENSLQIQTNYNKLNLKSHYSLFMVVPCVGSNESQKLRRDDEKF